MTGLLLSATRSLATTAAHNYNGATLTRTR